MCTSQLVPICAAQQVLGHFRGKFIDTVDADAIVHELVHQDIIANGDLTSIMRNPDAPQKNQYLHACLLRTCNEEALMSVCEIIIAVRGNPRMKGLGKEMKGMLGGKCCWVYVCTCVYVRLCEIVVGSCSSILGDIPALCMEGTEQTVVLCTMCGSACV